MGKTWDSFVPSPSVWGEVLRVLKPGGHILCAASTRTVDLMGISLRLGGFEIRDTIEWIYGSGFPKSLNISKALDKEAAKQWEGYGTALKPAHEPFILARKPIEKGLTIAQNCLKWGTGGLDIDKSKIETHGESLGERNHIGDPHGFISKRESLRDDNYQQHKQGRFPANVIHDGSAGVLDLFPESKSGSGRKGEIGKRNYLKESDSTSLSGKRGGLGVGGEVFFDEE
jgi:site-specific DNA-methyltransferase (adenine-specific)